MQAIAERCEHAASRRANLRFVGSRRGQEAALLGARRRRPDACCPVGACAAPSLRRRCVDNLGAAAGPRWGGPRRARASATLATLGRRVRRRLRLLRGVARRRRVATPPRARRARRRRRARRNGSSRASRARAAAPSPRTERARCVTGAPLRERVVAVDRSPRARGGAPCQRAAADRRRAHGRRGDDRLARCRPRSIGAVSDLARRWSIAAIDASCT